jgi:nitroreductase
MLNDRSSILSLLESRRSGRAREMVGSGPNDAEMERILAIAARAPDHGKLAPWRFVLIEDEQRDSLERLLVEALRREDPEALAAKRDKASEFAHYAGRLVVLLSAPVPNHKIPIWEQELSCGAVGMNLLIASHAMGFVAGWVTGWQAYSTHVRDALCEPGERIAGFVFIGQSVRELEERPRPALGDVVRTWSPTSD